MKFEWDEQKRQINIKKHCVDFVLGAKMLADSPYLVADTRKDYGEKRCQAIGEIESKVLVIAFTMRAHDVFRIISVRRANKRERRKYGYKG